MSKKFVGLLTELLSLACAKLALHSKFNRYERGQKKEVSAEEKLLDAMDEDYEEADDEIFDRFRMSHRRPPHNNKSTIDSFLGKSRTVNSVVILPRYYGELLTWALHRYIEKEDWQVIRTLCYRAPEPIYIDVSTDYDRCENLLMNGQLVLEKGDSHFIVTVDIHPMRNWVKVEGPAKRKNEMDKFTDGVKAIAKEQNFYRGKKIQFGARPHLLNVKDRSWDSIILDSKIKREIKANTIDFLNKSKRLAEYGIPRKRGVLMTGEPGTGKTIICKALMSEAVGITCITINAYALDADEYITDLYEMAQDIRPCIVFIEDIDLIGLNREEFGYQRGAALLSLLNVLDGVEEKQEIVTVATTNSLGTLDRAISQRPSRFDRVIKLSLPSLEQRKELISLLCQKIPIDETTRDYIARKSEQFTPAQLQEVIYSLAIEYPDESFGPLSPYLEVSKDDIDRAVSLINGRYNRHLGFDVENNHNDHNSVDLSRRVVIEAD